MKKITILATLLVASLGMSSDFARASEGACTTQPASSWRSVDDVTAAAEALGYSIRRVKVEGSCYEANAIDKDGKRLEVNFNPVTLEVVRVKEKS